MDATARTRDRLLSACEREGIAYPAARLDAAVGDFLHLVHFAKIIRDALSDDTSPDD